MDLEFPQVYVVSLVSRTDRRTKMIRRLESQNIKYEFIDALTPSDPEVIYLGSGSDTKNTQLQPVLRCTVGNEYACFASHLKALKSIIESGKSGIVLEDDALIHKDFKSIISKSLETWSKLPLVMLYTEVMVNEDFLKRGQKLEGLHKITNHWGAVGCWISLDYAKEAYADYHRPFNQIKHYRKTSECITMYSKGYFIMPQLCLEDPINISNLRDTRYNIWGREYYSRFQRVLNYDDYITNETEEYKKLYLGYSSILNGNSYEQIKENMSGVKLDSLDTEQKYVALDILFKLSNFMKDIMETIRISNLIETHLKQNPSHFFWAK